MSSIDERVVSMKFDNSQFQKGISTTMSSLEKLKGGLNLSGAAKSISELDAAGKRFNLSSMAQGVEQISSKFTAMGVIGVTALANIANRAINTGMSMVKALTISPIMAGFQEYELKMGSIQTILANTSMHGTTLKDVTASLEELNTYADKTIYNFGDMTKNIGLFTNAGLKLEESTQMIKGFSNEAAASGANAQQASGAAYQLSQALSKGKVTLEDWKSLTNNSMGNANMKQGLIDIADAMGTFEGRGTDATAAGKSFNETLEKGWLTADVMSNYLRIQAGDLGAEQMKTLGLSQQQIEHFIKQQKIAEESATKVRTWTQLWGTMQEQVGSSWATTWETLIGDFEGATELWTAVNNALGPMISAAGETRNRMLKDWKDLGGRDLAIEAVTNAFKALMSVFAPIKEAFQEIFPPTTGAQLFAITQAISNFTKGLVLSGTNMDALKRTFKGVFAVLDIGFMIIQQVVSVLFRLIGVVSGTGGGFLQVTATIGDFLVKVRDAIKNGEGLTKFFTVLGNILVVPLGLLRMLADLIGSVFKNLSMPKLDMPEMPDMPNLSGFSSAIENLKKNLNPLENLGNRIKSIWEGLGNVFAKVWDFFEPVAAKLGEAFRNLGTLITDSMKDVNYDQVLDSINTGLFAGLVLLIKNFLGKGKAAAEESGSVLDGIKDILGGVTDTLGAMQQTLKAKVLLTIAAAIALLAVAVIGLSMVDSEKLAVALGGLAGIFTQLMIALAILGTMTKGAGFLKLPFITASLILLAVAINLLVVAVKNMSTLSWEEMLTGLAGVAGLLIALSVASQIMNKQGGALIRTAASLVIVASAIRILVTAVRELGEIDKVNLTKGLIAVAGLLAALALYSQFSKVNKGALTSGAGLILLGVALKIIADVVKTLGEIDKVNLIKGVGAVSVILAALAGFSRAVGNPVQLLIASAAMIVIGKALQEISEAVKSMGEIDKVNLIKGLGAITAIMLAISAFSRTVGNPVQLLLASTAMIIIGNALREIGVSVKAMGEIDKVNLIKGLGAITAIMLAISAFSRTVGNPVQLVIAAAAMLIIGKGLQEIGVAVKAMGEIDKVNLIKGLAAITAILAAVAVFNAVSGNPVKMVVTAAAMVILGGAMGVIADAVIKLGGLSIESLAKGLVGMGAALVIIALAMSMMPLTMILSAAALVIVASALTTLGEVMLTMGGMSWEEIAKGLVVLAGSLVIIAGAMFLMTAAIPGAIALTIVAAALSVLAPVLIALGEMSWEQILIGLTALAGVFVVIGVAGLLLTPVIPTLMGLAIAIGLLGIGALAAGAGMLMFSMGLTAIGISGAVAIPILIELVKQIIALIPFALEQLGLGIVALAGVIAAAGGPLTAALVTLILALLNAINTLAPQIVSTVMNLIWLLLNTLMAHLPNLIDMGGNLVVALIDGIARNIGRIVTSATNLIVNFINGIANNIGRIIQAGVNLILRFMDGINQAVPQLMQAGANMIINFVESLASTIRNNQSRMNAAGRDLAWAIADGMTGGLASKAGELANKAANMAKGALDAAKNFLGIASPSKEFFKVGGWSAEGMGDGIEKNAGYASRAAEGMGETTLSVIKDTMSRIADLVDSDMDMTPTIRPVLDLSQMDKDLQSMGAMYGNPAIGVYPKAATLAEDMRHSTEPPTPKPEDPSAHETGPTYIQNNYSPKALSRSEIYRQTKNQLSVAKKGAPAK